MLCPVGLSDIMVTKGKGIPAQALFARPRERIREEVYNGMFR